MVKIICFFACLLSCFAYGELYLRENLKRAEPGDFIITYQNKTYTLMNIYDKAPDRLIIEEISVPGNAVSKNNFDWKEWVKQGAPHQSCWVRYTVNTETGKVENFYSFTQKRWLDMSRANSFLTTLLNLRLNHVPYSNRKKVGRNPGPGYEEWRYLWQPTMVVEGRTIPNVPFEAWKTYWPRDGSDLGGKEILVYIPAENDKYPSYFPYWLQITGLIERAKIRIIDSGRGMSSPKPEVINNFSTAKKAPRECIVNQ